MNTKSRNGVARVEDRYEVAIFGRFAVALVEISAGIKPRLETRDICDRAKPV